MKKLAFLFLTVVILSATATAGLNPDHLGLGVRAGFTIAGVANHPGSTESRTGYGFGVDIKYPLSGLLTLQAEFLVVGKGYVVPDTALVNEENETVGSAEWTALVGYFQIPVTAKFKLANKGKYRPYLLAGGYWAIPVQEKQRIFNNEIAYDMDLAGVRQFDWGLTFGAGIDIKAGDGWMSFDIRYDYSTQSLLKYTDYDSRTWLFQFGYWVNWGSL